MEYTCFLCGRSNRALDKHHAYMGVANRRLSEKYGAYVYLCHTPCHMYGKEAVHCNKDTDRRIKQYCQKKVMQEQNWDTEDFIKVFGRNYL